MGGEKNDQFDRVIGLLELIFSDTLAIARAKLRADPVVDAILDLAEDWQPVGSIKTQVSQKVGTSEKTVQRRVSELIEQRLLAAEGSGVTRKIKSTGLV